MNDAADLLARGDTDALDGRIVTATATLTWVAGVDGRMEHLGPGWAVLTGTDPAEHLGERWLGRVHPADRDPHLRIVAAARAAGRGWESEYRLQHVDGTERRVLESAVPFRGGWAGSAVDVTAHRHLAREELTRLWALTDRIADLIAITAPDGTALHLNAAGREIIGLAPDHPAAEVTLLGCVAPADRRRFAGVLREVESTGSWAGPMRFVDSAGTTIPVWQATVAHRDQGGRVAFLSTVAQDLRERRGGEPALHQERERYRTLVAQAPVGIWLADVDGATTFVNEHMAQLAGIDPDWPADGAWADHLHPDDRAEAQASWDAAVRDGSGWKHEHRIADAAGRIRFVTSSARPLRDAAGAVTGFLGTTVDVTEQREAERARRDTASEQAMRAVSDAAAARLRAMVDGLAAIVWEAEWRDGAYRFTFVSDRAEELLGFPTTRWLDEPAFWPGLIHVDDRAAALAYTARHNDDGVDHDVTYRACASDGRTVWLHQVVHLVRGRDDEPARAQGLTVDVTQARRGARSTELLAETGRLLADRGGRDQKLAALVRLLVHDFGDCAEVTLLGSDGLLRHAATAHDDPEVERARLELPPVPIDDDRRRRYATGLPVLLPVDPDGEPQTVLSVPLQVEGRLAGELTFRTHGARHHHDHIDLGLAAELGRRTSLMLESHRRRAREQQLQRVTADLASAATVAEAARRLLGRLRDITGASGSSMFLLDPDLGGLRLVHGVGYPPELLRRYATLRLDDATPMGQAVRTGSPVWIADAAAWSRGWPDLPVEAGTARQAAAALPLHSGGAVVGVVGITFPTARTFPPDERAFVAALTAQAAPALERAAAADERRVIAESLQNSLLPSTLPELERLVLAARYLPGAHGTQAGGDWYDVLPLDGTRVAIAVGDVVGQGARAAAVMGQLRSVLSAYLLEGHGPVRALEHLDRYSTRVPGAAGSTVTCLIVDRATGELTWARAGHPPPLVVGPGGPRFLEDATGTVLAVRGRPPYVAGHAHLEPGESVVLYTDGLVERRGEVVDDGLDRLAAAAGAAHARPPAALVAALMDACLDDGPADDVAVMVARLLPPVLDLDLPADPRQLRGIREVVAEWSAAAGMHPDEAYDLQLSVGEAAANVAEHAYGGRAEGQDRMRVRMEHGGGDRVAVTVSDDGRWRPPPVDRGHRGRGLELIDQIARDVEVAHDETGTRVAFVVPITARPEPTRAADPVAIGPGSDEEGATTVRVRADGAQVAVVGDLDPAGAAAVGPVLLAAARSGSDDLVLDLRGVTHLGRAGSGLLRDVLRAAGGRPVRLQVLAGSAVARLLVLGGESARVETVPER